MSRAPDLFGLPPAKTRRREEFDFQVSLVSLLRLTLPKDAVVMHVPNGGPVPSWRSKAAALGAMAGAPDLFIFWNAATFAFECKSLDGDCSTDQLDAHHRLSAAGVRVATVRTIESAMARLGQWGIPVRGKITVTPLQEVGKCQTGPTRKSRRSKPIGKHRARAK